jgi:hypothetical protein
MNYNDFVAWPKRSRVEGIEVSIGESAMSALGPASSPVAILTANLRSRIFNRRV